MIPLTHLADRRVLLFGLGGSGLATAEALVAGGADVIAWDDNPSAVERAEGRSIATEDLRRANWAAAEALVIAPGVPLTHPQPHWSVQLARRNGVEVIGDVELFFRERRHTRTGATVVAITGTNGKSTTTALIAHVLEQAGRDVRMGGNIGRAVLTLEPFGNDAIYVVEVSSYQIDTAPTLDPDVGVLLNLSPDHIDRHGTFENYAAVKERLAVSSRRAVVGIDDDKSAAIAARLNNAKRVSVRRIVDSAGFDGGKVLYGGERVGDLDEFPALNGPHNAFNALAALHVCEPIIGLADTVRGFCTFPGLAHRLERIGTVGGVLFVNDSKATNADAAATGLQSFPRVRWIAGGLSKDGGIETLAPFFSRVEKAYLIGEAAPEFAATLGAATIPYEIAGTVQQAVNHALADAEGSKSPAIGEAVVLLSPAAASFDQFRNFEERGEAYRRAVEQLEGFEPV